MIPIKNVYHMLSYAFQTLQNQGYRSLATEDFENVADLCAAILCKGVADQIRQGLGRAYVRRTESMSCPRGQIEMAQSIQSRAILKRQLVCSYNKSTQKKKDDAIKRATMFDFWNNMILQCMHILSYKYPLYHLACDIDDMEKFVKERITPIQIQCQNTIRYYSAALTKLEFETLNNVLLQSQIITSSIDGPLWNEIRGEKERYHRFYDFLGNRDKALQELSEKDYYEIRKNVKCFYLQLRSYLNALENAIDLFHYLFHESESYKKLHSDIIKADTKNQGLLDK